MDGVQRMAHGLNHTTAASGGGPRAGDVGRNVGPDAELSDAQPPCVARPAKRLATWHAVTVIAVPWHPAIPGSRLAQSIGRAGLRGYAAGIRGCLAGAFAMPAIPTVEEKHMVQAIRFHQTGGPEVLHWKRSGQRPRPRAGARAPRAVGLNFIDTYHRSGLYPLPLPSVSGSKAPGWSRRSARCDWPRRRRPRRLCRQPAGRLQRMRNMPTGCWKLPGHRLPSARP